MANSSDGLFRDYMRERWTASSAPTAGTTCVASVGNSATMHSKARNIVESLIYSARNVTAATVTLTASIRAASIAGTVLASWDILLAANASVQDCFAQLNIPAPRGQDLFAEFGTPATSVTQKVSIAGWTEVSQVD
jgi:hypothetical protein